MKHGVGTRIVTHRGPVSAHRHDALPGVPPTNDALSFTKSHFSRCLPLKLVVRTSVAKVLGVYRLSTALLFLSAIVGVGALVASSELAATICFGLLIASAEISLIARLAGGFSLVHIPVLTVNGIFLTAPLLWGEVQGDAFVSLGRFAASEEINIQIAMIGIVFSAAFTVGALVVGPRRPDISLARFRQIGISIPNGTLVATGYIAIFLAIYGSQGAILSGRYLEMRGPSWAIMLSTAGVPLAMLTFSLVSVKHGRWRWLAILGLIVIVLISFGRASRVLVLLPAFFVFARAFSLGKPVNARSGLLALAGAFLLLPLPLAGRANLYGVGIFPLGAQLFSRPEEILAAFSATGLAGNILVSGPLASSVANRPIPPQSFWISVNPLPGTIAGWNEIKDSLRFNVHTPYNALGELAAHGWIAVAVYGLLVGMALSIASRMVLNFRGGYHTIASLFALAVTARFSLSVLQYNLRNCTRLIWWMLLGLAVIWIVSIILNRRNHSTPGSRGGCDQESIQEEHLERREAGILRTG